MRIFELVKGHKMGILSFLLVAVAAALGADSSFAMAEGIVVNPAKEGMTNEEAGFEADGKGMHTVDSGAATTTKADETEFTEEEIDRKIADAFLFNFPFQWYIVNMARQQPVKTYHPIHYRSGSAKLDLETKAAVTSTAGGDGVTQLYVDLSTANVVTNLKALKVYSTVFFRDVPGYNPKTGIQKGDLMGYVTSTDNGVAKILLLNPKGKDKGTPETTVIPEKTRIFVGASAGSETQLQVPPDNTQPVASQVYLQKKLSNIIWSKDWEATAKKADFAQEDLRQNALWIFKFKNAISHWLGTQMVENIEVGGDLGEERVYFEEGLLNQVNMMYSYDPDKLTPEDFNAIARMQFTRFSKNSHAVAFCGAGFLEKMQNMDVQKVQTVSTKSVEITGGLIVKRWDNVFGNIDFVYDPIFSEIGFEDFAFICDIKELTRYVKREQKGSVLDMEKTGEAREAKREMTSIIDCVATRGYNNVLVGPSDQIAKAKDLGSMETIITPVTELPSNPKDGDVIYFKSASGAYKEGDLLEYVAETKEWKDYNGAL
jgi:hypothetical protein